VKKTSESPAHRAQVLTLLMMPMKVIPLRIPYQMPKEQLQ